MRYTGRSPGPLPQRCAHDSGRESAREKFSFPISQRRDERWSLDKIRPIFSQLGCKPRSWAELVVGEGQPDENSNAGGREGREIPLSGSDMQSPVGTSVSLLSSGNLDWPIVATPVAQARVGLHASICSGNGGLQKHWIRRMRALPSLDEDSSSRLYP